MKQTNPDPVERYWPTLGLGVGPGETIDHPEPLPGMVPAEAPARCDICPDDPTMCLAPHCRRDDFERRPASGPAEVGPRPDAAPARKPRRRAAAGEE